ncbi:MAG: GC-type dockerin domain-anchored protein [Planctomycetota bacterium]
MWRSMYVWLVSVAGGALGQLPTEIAGYEVLARAEGQLGNQFFMLPVSSSLQGVTPSINNAGDVTFAYTNFSNGSGRVTWVNGQSVSIPFGGEVEPSVGDGGRVVWAVGGSDPQPQNRGVWTYQLSTGVTARLTSAPAGATDWGIPVVADDGTIASRVTTPLGPSVGTYAGSDFVPVAASDGVPFTFFSDRIAINSSGSVAARAFDSAGRRGIFLFDGAGGVAPLLVHGATSPTGNTVESTLVGLDINGSSRVAVLAFTSGGDEILGVDADGTVTVYATEFGGIVSDIDAVPPRINDDGWIVFRGRNAAGDEAAFVSDGVDILEIASVGTGLQADFGPAVVGGVVGGVDINNAGQAVINAELRQPPLSSGRGLAIVRVDIVPQDDCPADVNGDGELTPADFNAWVIAFNGQLPPCDQNGDGLCNPADFNAWVVNFNGGC